MSLCALGQFPCPWWEGNGGGNQINDFPNSSTSSTHISGRSRGVAQGAQAPPPLFWVKKKRKRKKSRQNKQQKTGPPLSSRSGSATAYIQLSHTQTNSQHRTPPVLKRSGIYWSWSSLLQYAVSKIFKFVFITFWFFTEHSCIRTVKWHVKTIIK